MVWFAKRFNTWYGFNLNSYHIFMMKFTFDFFWKCIKRVLFRCLDSLIVVDSSLNIKWIKSRHGLQLQEVTFIFIFLWGFGGGGGGGVCVIRKGMEVGPNSWQHSVKWLSFRWHINVENSPLKMIWTNSI